MKVIDLTHTIRERMPVYPGTDAPRFIPANSYEKDGFKETLLQMYTHTGTHMDPPAHLFAGRTTLDQFPAEQFIGKALVIDCRGVGAGGAITRDLVERYGEKAREADFLLFNLGWLPGGDKSITTLRESTMPAVEAAIELMDRDAILNIAVYPGHAEGDAEGRMLCDYLSGVSRHKICATQVKILNSPTSPYFIVIETKP